LRGPDTIDQITEKETTPTKIRTAKHTKNNLWTVVDESRMEARETACIVTDWGLRGTSNVKNLNAA